jgi:hypothetical protein
MGCEREPLPEPDVRIRLTERAWKFDPDVIRVKKGQVAEITFEPTDNGLGVGHGFAVSSYDEVADFELLDQDGRPVRLGQFRGKAVLLTFIYTRCTISKLLPADVEELC